MTDMPLYIREKDVDSLLTMEEAIEQVRRGFEIQAEDGVISLPRSRLKSGKGTLNIMPAAIDGVGLSGLKVYYGNRSGASFVVVLFSVEDTRPVCIVEAGRLGQLRTGAASGIMTDMMARKDAAVLACVGTGYQAETQVEAISLVRDIDTVLVSGTSAAKAADFARRLSEKHGVNAEPADSSAAMGRFDILVTATDSRTPVIQDGSIPEDCHINAIGSNHVESAELETSTFCSAKNIVVDSREQALMESGDVVKAVRSGGIREDYLNEAWQLFAGNASPNPDATTDRTIFKSLGIGMEDLVTARYVYEKAVKSGLGQQL